MKTDKDIRCLDSGEEVEVIDNDGFGRPRCMSVVNRTVYTLTILGLMETNRLTNALIRRAQTGFPKSL